jgi:hypothetical protein
MILWLALIVPVVLVTYLLIFQRQNLTWWEPFVVILVPVMLIALSKFIIETTQTQDVEYWGGWVTSATYNEPWDERVSCRHPIYGTDSDGNSYLIGYSHSYDVDNHPAYWMVYGSNGEEISIDPTLFDYLTKKFGNEKKVELNHNFYSYDGEQYVTTYPNIETKLEPLTTKHTYENRTQAAETIYKQPKIEEAEANKLKLYKYADVYGYYSCPTVLAPSVPASVSVAFERLNAQLGRSEEIRVWVMVFVDKPQSIATMQERYWQGGNKNELNICIGTDSSGKVEWIRTFSWTEKNAIKVEIRDYLLAQKNLDLEAFCTWLKPAIISIWERKHFAEFSYLTVEPPGWTIFLVWILTIVIDGAITLWVITNEEAGFPMLSRPRFKEFDTPYSRIKRKIFPFWDDYDV